MKSPTACFRVDDILHLFDGQIFNREILKKSEYYQIRGEKITETDTLVIQVNNRMGEEDISIPYTKGDKLSIDGAWIEDMEGGVIRKLSPKEIKNRNYNSESVFFGDDFIQYFSLKHTMFIPTKSAIPIRLPTLSRWELVAWIADTRGSRFGREL